MQIRNVQMEASIMKYKKISLIILSFLMCACSTAPKEIEKEIEKEPSVIEPEQSAIQYDRVGVTRKERVSNYFEHSHTDLKISEKIYGAGDAEVNDSGEFINVFFKKANGEQLLVTRKNSFMVYELASIYDIKTDSYFSFPAFEPETRTYDSIYNDGALIYTELIDEPIDEAFDSQYSLIAVKLFRDGETKTLSLKRATHRAGFPKFVIIDNTVYFGSEWEEKQDEGLQICHGVSKIENDEEIQINKVCDNKIVDLGEKEVYNLGFFTPTGSKIVYKDYFIYLTITKEDKKNTVHLLNTKDGSIKEYPLDFISDGQLALATSNGYFLIASHSEKEGACQFTGVQMDTGETVDYGIQPYFYFENISDQLIYGLDQVTSKVSYLEINDLGELMIYGSEIEGKAGQHYIRLSNNTYFTATLDGSFYSTVKRKE